MNAKPVVEYDPTFPVEIIVGVGAFVKPINHPNQEFVSNKKMVLTSPVINAMRMAALKRRTPATFLERPHE